jgi:4a-hydroxytetrahydrobiopterin dehydratase
MIPMTKLTASQIKTARKGVPDWQYDGKEIRRLFVFTDFAAAMRFVNKVARLAEQADHHPDIDIRWNKVSLSLVTHSAGGLTRNDFTLARKIDRL